MKQFRLNPRLINKALTACLSLSVLAVVAGSQLAPKLPLPTLLLYCALGAIALLLVLSVAAVLLLTLHQFVLRQGGTDSQWFWFRGEPPGLAQLRAQAKGNAPGSEV